MNNLLNLKVVLIVIAFLLAALGFRNTFVAIFVKGKYEVIYGYDESVRVCFEGYCIYSAELSIANTGEADQERVVVEIDNVPGGLRGGVRVLNLSATEPRSAEPVIDSRYEDGVSIFEIGDFTPGALVLIKFSGFYPREEQTDSKPMVEVSARGRVIEGDARAITFGRYVTLIESQY